MNSRVPPSQRLPSPANRAAPHGVFFVLSAVIALACLIAVYAFYVRTSSGQYIDESALEEAAGAQRAIGAQTAKFLDALPVTSVVIAAVVVLFVTLVRRRWLAAAISIGSMVAANLSTQVIKAALPDRPDRGVVTLDLNSLPSGHSTVAASAAVAVFLVVSPRWRPFAAFAGGTFAVFSGLSTLINQWHRPADVVAGFAVVACWASLAGLGVMRTGDSWNVWRGYGRHWASSRLWPLASLVAVLLSAAMVAVLLRELTPEGGGHVSTTNYFWVGVSTIVLSGYLLCLAGTLLFGGEARKQKDRPQRVHSRPSTASRPR
jgi:membrane-associated phospholipid phosphatase